jgi:outer membrane immunogenic protein
MIRRMLFAASATVVMAGAAAAHAQDAAPLWSGWYVGANLGGTWGDTSHHLTATPGAGAVVIPPADASQISLIGSSNSNPGGFTAGGEGGYNWMFKYQDGGTAINYVLVGLETDFDYLDLKQSRSGTFQSALMVNPAPSTPVTATVSQGTKTEWIWTVRPRLGYATGSWLFYATAGLALSDIKLTTSYADTFSPANVGSASKTSTEAGWTAGAGIGYAISPTWSLKAEYLYASFGSVSQTAVISNGYGSITSSTDAKANIARVGVDYRF